VGESTEREEAILEGTGKEGTISQVLDRLSLGVEHLLYAFDDFTAMGQEELQKFEMCLKRHRFANHNAPRDLLACGRLCVKGRSLVGLMCDASNSGGDQDDTCDEGCADRFPECER